MAELRIGERLTLNGRVHVITGFTAMSVKPRRMFLEDVETGKRVVVEAAEIAPDSAA